MNKQNENLKKSTKKPENLSELCSAKNKETPIERALKLSSDEIIAMAIRDVLARDILSDSRKKLN